MTDRLDDAQPKDIDIAQLDVHRLDLRSADIVEPRAGELAHLYPETIRDGKIDLEALGAALGDVVEDTPEKFGLSWPGKGAAIRMAQRQSRGTLTPMVAESVNWNSTTNIIIEGENLEVLKLLQRSYHGKFKLIYIDPPYNTGKDFVYPDSFRDPLGAYLRFSEQVSEDGGRLHANAETSGRYHSTWLSMMWPRLHVARPLLSEDGVIVVSIDDNEGPRIRLVLDEIFGEENFIAQMVWEGGRKNDAAFVSVGHDYMITYARNLSALKESDGRWRVAKPGVADLQRVAREIAPAFADDPAAASSKWRAHLAPLARKVRAFAAASKLVADERPDIAREFPELRNPETELPGARYNNIDARGAYRVSDLSWPGGGGPEYDLPHPRTGEPVRQPSRGWLYGETEMKRLVAEGRVDFKADESGVPEFKRYLDEVESEVMTSVFYRTRTRAQQALNDLMGGDVFDFPKDVEILAKIMEATTDDDSLVLDFFAGSGSFAEACLTLNERLSQQRRYVIAQAAEPVERGGYESLAALCRERVRRADKRIAKQAGREEVGFRAYRLDTSALASTAPELSESGPLEFDLDGVAAIPDREDEALLTEVLLARGFELVAPTQWSLMDGMHVASVGSGALVACFTPTLSLAQFEALIELEPAQLILLESSFGGADAVKVNALQHLRTANEHRDTAIELLLL